MKKLYQTLTAKSTYNFMDVPQLRPHFLYKHNNRNQQQLQSGTRSVCWEAMYKLCVAPVKEQGQLGHLPELFLE